MKRKLTTKASYAATHLCGICAAMAVLMCLAFTSCSKDYPKLVKERVEQYRKEGKWVLSYSKNATEDGHFIVYADEKTQTIVVDSIDGMETANLKASAAPSPLETTRSRTLQITRMEFAEDKVSTTP